jgi:hypothetical protein
MEASTPFVPQFDVIALLADDRVVLMGPLFAEVKEGSDLHCSLR